MDTQKSGSGGRGGDASVDGDDSTAQGGAGGEAVIGDGGPGGNARVIGDSSSAAGGQGGRGGLGPGAPGGHAEVIGNNIFAAGGQGGESSQADGRGGRGGRPYDFLSTVLGLPSRPHTRLPYGEPNNEPGRGGDAADTPQYKARRLIIEGLKARYPEAGAMSSLDRWYDRDVVELAWLNEQLRRDGHRWRVKVVDYEYEFIDVL